MPRPIASALALLVCAASVGIARGAETNAAIDAPTSVPTDAIVWATAVAPGCSVRASQLAREVDLACDAAGKTCRRADRGAEQRAVLSCADARRWTIEARDAQGTRLWTLALDGPRESRTRVAAMWIARAQRGAPPPEAPLVSEASAPASASGRASTSAPASSAPVSATASASAPGSAHMQDSASAVPFAPPAPESSSASTPTSAPASVPEPDRSVSSPAPTPAAARSHDPSPQSTANVSPDSAARTAASSRHGGLAAAIRGLASSGLQPQALGVNVRAVTALPHRLSLGATLGASRSIGGSSAYGLSTAHGAATLAWGAPWNDGLLGASIEAGALVGVVNGATSVTPSSHGFADPYAAIAIIGAHPISQNLRGWIGLTFIGLARPVRITERDNEVAFLPSAMAAIDAGLAWAAW